MKKAIALIVFSFMLFGCMNLDEITGKPVTTNETLNQTELNASIPDSLRVCLFGDSTETLTALTDENQSFEGRQITLKLDSLDYEMALAGDVSDCALIILKSEHMSRATRSAVINRVNAGANLIVLKNAATRVPGDASAYGWELGLGTTGALSELIPVSNVGPGKDLRVLEEVTVSGEFVFRNLMLAFSGIYNFELENWNVTDVYFTDRAVPVADIVLGGGNRSTSVSYPAIVMQDLGVGKGIVFYFGYAAFDLADEHAQGVSRAAVSYSVNDYLKRVYLKGI
ncbi:MAG: hypothetical protein V1834_02700 [Candidatus Micrarchaeota archaeon]